MSPSSCMQIRPAGSEVTEELNPGIFDCYSLNHDLAAERRGSNATQQMSGLYIFSQDAEHTRLRTLINAVDSPDQPEGPCLATYGSWSDMGDFVQASRKLCIILCTVSGLLLDCFWMLLDFEHAMCLQPRCRWFWPTAFLLRKTGAPGMAASAAFLPPGV